MRKHDNARDGSGMTRAQRHAFAALFMALLLVMPALMLLLPGADYSQLEKRVLAALPRFTTQSGQFSRDCEDYLADHLPLREALIGLDAYRRLYAGLQIAGAVVRENGALNEAPIARDDEKLLRNLTRLGDFGQAIGRRVTALVPPSAGAVRARVRGRSLLPYADEDMLRLIAQSGAVDAVPLYDAFVAGGGALFYTTDPHWNENGAYLAYARLCEALGYAPLSAGSYTVTSSPGFYGTCYARSGLWLTQPDTLALWDAGQDLTVTLDGRQVSDSPFFTEHLTTGDQYPVYLDGNHGLTVIDNASCVNGRRLLLIKDSFGNSLVPLLAPHYAQIVVIDLRAYREPVSALCGERGFDDVVAVYCLDRLVHDDNLAWLR